MEIICDTNIWYGLGNGFINPSLIGEGNKLIATFNNIDEFSRTTNLIDNPDETRKSIQSMFKHSGKHPIIEPPLFYLRKLSDDTYSYEITEDDEAMQLITEKIAKGHKIDVSKSEQYRQYSEKRKANLQSVADIFNKESLRIKSNIKDKKKHRKVSSIELIRGILSLFVKKQTGEGLYNDFDFEQIELLENAIDCFFKELETGATVMTANDWYDLFNMAYVSPERKYWTGDKKWIRLIKEAGMEKYLFC